MRFNLKRGLIRIWVVLSLVAAIPLCFLCVPPALKYNQSRNAITVNLTVPNIQDLTVRIDRDFLGLSLEEQSAVVDRVYYFLAPGDKLEAYCRPLQDQFSSRGLPFPKAIPLSSAELDSIRSGFSEYADLGPEELKMRLEKKIIGCVGRGDTSPLEARLERVAASANTDLDTGGLIPLAYGTTALALMWLGLMAAFWIAQGFVPSAPD